MISNFVLKKGESLQTLAYTVFRHGEKGIIIVIYTKNQHNTYSWLLANIYMNKHVCAEIQLISYNSRLNNKISHI